MENAYQPELWHDLYVMLGTSSAALIGLLFVVTSLHLDEIVNNPVFRVRARNNTYYLIFTLVEATLILTPQPMAILGIGLVALNLSLLWLPVRNIYRYFYRDREISRRGGWTVYRALAFILAFLLGVLGGALTIAHSVSGLYLVTAAYVIFLVTVVLNSWAIMLGVGEKDQARKRSAAGRKRR